RPLSPPPPNTAATSHNRRDQQNGCGDGIIAVAVPQLLELFPTDFLVDFVKDVGHERPPNPALARTHRTEAGYPIDVAQARQSLIAAVPSNPLRNKATSDFYRANRHAPGRGRPGRERPRRRPQPRPRSRDRARHSA